jgi:cytochrome c553
MMKAKSLRLVLPTAIVTIVLSATGRADETTGAASPKPSLQAKIEYCTTCHGLSGQGYRAFYTMPRLAGQQTEYFVNQLRAFVERRRENKYMYSVAHALNPAMLTGLAAHFHGLNPKPLGGAPKALVAAGKKIYEEGVPESNVPACMACHGPDAKGRGEIPRLAGQLHDYILSKLANLDRERGQGHASPDTSALMLPTSHSLTKAQTASIAAYVSYLQ